MRWEGQTIRGNELDPGIQEGPVHDSAALVLMGYVAFVLCRGLENYTIAPV